MSKARDLSDFISTATIDSTELADLSVTHAKLHATMDLTSKTVTLANDAISGNNVHGGVISNFASTGIDDNADALAITITSAENVGIGATSPASRLDVLNGTANTQVASFSGADAGGGLKILTASTTRNDDTVILKASDAYGEIAFTSDNTEVMRITKDNLVGIGTTTPSFESGTGTGLEIRNASGNGAHVKLTDNASGAGGSNGFDLYAFNTSGYIENYEAGSLVFRNNGAQRMRIDSAGRLSLGPDAQDIQIDPASTNSGINLLYMRGNASGDKAEISLNHYGYHNYHIGAGLVGNGKFSIGTAQTANSFVMDTSGNVGIGTTSPASKLDVNGAIHISTDTAGKNTFRLTSNAANDANLIMKSDTTDKVQIQANGVSYFNGGNVGIGTTTPADPLHVQFSNNTGADTGIIVKNTNTGTTTNFAGVSTQAVNGSVLGTFSSADYDAWGIGTFAGSQSNHPTYLIANNSVKMVIDSNGTIGINATPNANWSSIFDGRIDVGGGGLVVGNEEAVHIGVNWYYDGSAYRYRNTGTASSMYHHQGNTVFQNVPSGSAGSTFGWVERMRIDSSGNVLVGKPSTNSDVNGVELLPNGQVYITANNTLPFYINRRGTSGNNEFARFSDDGATRGTIASSFDNELTISASGTNSSGILFSQSNQVRPMKNGSTSNGTQDLGAGNGRWKDIYLTGGIDFNDASSIDTGGESNLLNDYETGTWTPKLKDLNGNEASAYQSGYPKGTYTKIGRHVWVNFSIRITNKGSMSGNYVFIANLPFNKDSTAEGRGTGSIDYYSGLATTKSYLALDTTSTVSVFWLVGGTNATGSHYVTVANLNNTCMFKGGGNYIST